MKVKISILDDFPNYTIRSDGKVYSLKRCIFLRPGLSHNGYNMVILQNNGTRKTFRVCRLVATCFISNPENKATVNHINGIKTDDREINLEWNTHKENTIHSFETGLQKPKYGEKTNFSKLTWEIVDKIKKLDKPNCKTLAKEYNVSTRSIYRIIKGETWTQKL